jgi:hypothetical protein
LCAFATLYRPRTRSASTGLFTTSPVCHLFRCLQSEQLQFGQCRLVKRNRRCRSQQFRFANTPLPIHIYRIIIFTIIVRNIILLLISIFLIIIVHILTGNRIRFRVKTCGRFKSSSVHLSHSVSERYGRVLYQRMLPGTCSIAGILIQCVTSAH